MRQIEDIVVAGTRDVERRLQEYQALLSNDSVGIVVVCEGDIVQCNSSAARLFGWQARDLLGRSAATFFGSDDEFQSFASRIGDALAADGSPAIEWRTVRQDGSRFWSRLLVKSITPGGPAGETVWMVEDISARKEMEAALAKARDDLEHGPTSGWWPNYTSAAKSKSAHGASRCTTTSPSCRTAVCSSRDSMKRCAITSWAAIAWLCW
jgi:PAS domain S-box-containing protein